jgi:thiol-disulfide isomerase/thioredoxin
MEEWRLIYDFSAKINIVKKRSFKPETFLKGPIEMEVQKNSAETIGTDMLAPAFSATELSTGEKAILPALKGKVVLLDFWYLSCMPCRILMPKIQQLKNKFKAQGLEVIGINMVDTSATQIQDFLSGRGISYRQFFKPENMTNSYKLYAFPTIVIIGSDSRIKLVEIGEAPDTETKLEQAISSALSIPSKPLATNTNQH